MGRFSCHGAAFRALLLPAAIALAAPCAAAAGEAGGEAAAAADTRIEVDEAAGTVTIVIGGKPAVLIDETGLHVRENVGYGGMLTDTGKAGFDAIAGQSRGESDAE